MTGFVPPPYPYERLGEIAAVAAAHDGGAVDLSIGTPCDPPPPEVIEALSLGTSARGYPPSIGTAALRAAVARWIAAAPRRGGRPGRASSPRASGPRSSSPPCRSTCGCATRLATPFSTRRELPDVRDGRHAGRAAGAVPYRALDEHRRRRTPTARCALWVNSPATRPASCATWRRPRPGAARMAFRCSRTSATPSSAGRPRRRRSCGQRHRRCARRALAVEARQLRRRPDRLLRGRPRAGRYLREVRKHAGLMPPGPVQASSRRGARRRRARRGAARAVPRAACSDCGRSSAPAGYPGTAARRRVLPVGRQCPAATPGPRRSTWLGRPASSSRRASSTAPAGRPLPGRGGSAGRAHRPRRQASRRLSDDFGRSDIGAGGKMIRPLNTADTTPPYDPEVADLFDGYRLGAGVGRDDRRRPAPPARRTGRCTTRSRTPARTSCAASVGHPRPFLPQPGRHVRRRRRGAAIPARHRAAGHRRRDLADHRDGRAPAGQDAGGVPRRRLRAGPSGRRRRHTPPGHHLLQALPPAGLRHRAAERRARAHRRHRPDPRRVRHVPGARGQRASPIRRELRARQPQRDAAAMGRDARPAPTTAGVALPATAARRVAAGRPGRRRPIRASSCSHRASSTARTSSTPGWPGRWASSWSRDGT